MDEGRGRFARVEHRTYRVFIFDQGRCLRRTELIECTDDKDAIASARALAGKSLSGWSVEVWHLARRVFASQALSLIALFAADLAAGQPDLCGLFS